MGEDRRAEWILSLVTTPERASATVGDLMEDIPRRGTTWFRLSTLRAAAGCLYRDLTTAPLQMAGAAAISWFGYMLLVAVLMLAGYVLEHAAWSVLYVLTNHTGLELLSDALHLKFEWNPVPSPMLRFTDALGIFVIAPYYSGRIVADAWKERAIAFTIMLTLVWSLMLAATPIVGMFGDHVSLITLPVIAFFVFLGVMKMRLNQIRAKQSDALAPTSR